MKFVRTLMSVVVAVSGCAALAAAKNLYVSADKSYGADLVPEDQLFDDIQAAIDKAVKGDTVWVKDGFVCESGSKTHSKRGASRIYVDSKNITIRGESGDWRTGPIIHGKYAETADGRGEGAIRCVYAYGAMKLIGFRLIGGATTSTKDAESSYGGCAWGCSGPVFENCMISNCVANMGGGTYRISLKGCLVVDNTATGVWNSYGGGAYGAGTATDCVIASNFSSAGGAGTYKMDLVGCTVTNNVAETGYGGGVYDGTLLTNCVVAFNRASSGGGVASSTAYDCNVYSNKATATKIAVGGGGLYKANAWKTDIWGNESTASGGGVCGACWLVDCGVSNNLSKAYGGGGCYKVSATNCTLSGNVARGTYPCYGGGGFGGTYVKCRILGNSSMNGGGGLGSEKAATSLTVDGCWIEGNFATNSYGGGGVCGSSSTKVSNCTVTNNASSKNGGGISGAGLVIDSTIVGNSADGTSGGGVSSCTVVSNCWIAGNSAKSGGGATGGSLYLCTLTNNTCTYRGCGFNDSTLYNCRIVGNKAGSGFNGGGGGCEGTCHNCLIANNKGSGFSCYAKVSKLVNCTIMGNGGAGFSTGLANGLRAVNVISWGNGAADKATLISSNCCLNSGYTVPEGSFNVFSADPRLTPDENGNLVPKNRKCRNRGTVFDWMTDPNDVRSKDLAGKDRILGSAPDFGCFESKIYGLSVLIR